MENRVSDAIKTGDYYTAHQVFVSLAQRKGRAKKLDDALMVLLEGMQSLSKYGQTSSVSDMAQRALNIIITESQSKHGHFMKEIPDAFEAIVESEIKSDAYDHDSIPAFVSFRKSVFAAVKDDDVLLGNLNAEFARRLLSCESDQFNKHSCEFASHATTYDGLWSDLAYKITSMSQGTGVVFSAYMTVLLLIERRFDDAQKFIVALQSYWVPSDSQPKTFAVTDIPKFIEDFQDVGLNWDALRYSQALFILCQRVPSQSVSALGTRRILNEKLDELNAEFKTFVDCEPVKTALIKLKNELFTEKSRSSAHLQTDFDPMAMLRNMMGGMRR